jgi:hypothetical protein
MIVYRVEHGDAVTLRELRAARDLPVPFGL